MKRDIALQQYALHETWTQFFPDGGRYGRNAQGEYLDGRQAASRGRNHSGVGACKVVWVCACAAAVRLWHDLGKHSCGDRDVSDRERCDRRAYLCCRGGLVFLPDAKNEEVVAQSHHRDCSRCSCHSHLLCHCACHFVCINNDHMKKARRGNFRGAPCFIKIPGESLYSERRDHKRI